METKLILGIVISLVLIGGAVGCSYMFDNSAQPSEKTSVAAGNSSLQNTTNGTHNQTANDTTKKTKATTKTIKQTCTKCDGNGYFKCSSCGGDGYKESYCSDCGGDGDKPPVEGMVSIMCHPCPTCEGDGKLKLACSVCGGDGKIQCSSCGGEGYKLVTLNQ